MPPVMVARGGGRFSLGVGLATSPWSRPPSVAAGIVGLAAGIVALVRRRQRPARHLPSPSPSAVGAAKATAEPVGSLAPPPPGGSRSRSATGQPASHLASLSPLLSGTSLTALLVAAAIPLAWLVDINASSPLTFNSPLGMNTVVAGRFLHGVSNTAFALVAGALVVVITGVWEVLGGGRQTQLLTALGGGAARRWGPAAGRGRGRRPDSGADAGLPSLQAWRRSAPELAALAGHQGLAVLVVGGFAVVDLLPAPVGPHTWGATARRVTGLGRRRVPGAQRPTRWSAPSSRKPVMAAALACAVVIVVAALWWGRRQVCRPGARHELRLARPRRPRGHSMRGDEEIRFPIARNIAPPRDG